MSKETSNLGLFEYDPSTDGALTFNITKALNENWDKIDAAVLLALSAAAPYSSQTYAKGAYCTRGGRLYRCTTSITTAEAWTAGHWTETTVTAELIAHAANKSNPHVVTAAQVGLGKVNNTSDSDKPVSTAQATAIADAKKAGTDAQTNLNNHAANKSNPHGVTAALVGAYTKGETDTLLGYRAKIAIGSYVGTGVWGANNPNKLTFDFEPKIVFIMANQSNRFFPGTAFIRGMSWSGGLGETPLDPGKMQNSVSWNGNTVSWYALSSDGSVKAQMNASGVTYFYCALG